MIFGVLIIYLFSLVIKALYRLKKKEFLLLTLIIEIVYFSCAYFIIQNAENYNGHLEDIFAAMFTLELIIIFRTVSYLYGIEKNVYWNMKNSQFILPFAVDMNSRFARKHKSQILNILERLLWTNSVKAMVLIKKEKNKFVIDYFFKHREDFYEYLNMLQVDESYFKEVEMFEGNDKVLCAYVEEMD